MIPKLGLALVLIVGLTACGGESGGAGGDSGGEQKNQEAPANTLGNFTLNQSFLG